MNVRTAKPHEFIFKRDDTGRETVEHQGQIVAVVAAGDYRLIPDTGITSARLVPVIKAAQEAGFWKRGRGQSRPLFSVSVEVAP